MIIRSFLRTINGINSDILQESDYNIRMDESLRVIGEQIKKTRKELRLSQIQLAELAGISYRPIYLIEDGKSIRLETLIQICEVLSLKVTLAPKGGMTLD